MYTNVRQRKTNVRQINTKCFCSSILRVLSDCNTFVLQKRYPARNLLFNIARMRLYWGVLSA